MSLNTILLVDSDCAFLMAAISYLMSHKDVVVIGTAGWGDQALAQAEDLHPDTVVIDLGLADSAALQVIRCLRATLPNGTIIALSSQDTQINRRVALAAGADECFPKDELTSRLLPAIRRLVARDSNGEVS